MNFSKILMLGAFAGLCLSSCMEVNEDLPINDSLQGSMSLEVNQLRPSATRAVETSDYPVSIYSASDSKLFASYAKASEVPAKLLMPVGNYYVEAHSPGSLTKIMDAPYYSGRDDIEILQNINTVSKVVCRMANGSVTVQFTDEFASTFTSWTLSINDGSNTSMVYTSEDDGLNPPTKYIKFEENVSQLNVNFVGMTKKDNRITSSCILTKKQASESYDGDNDCFSGGDAIVLVLNTPESTEGDITGVEIKASIKFEESDESFDMEVEDKIPDEEEGGDTPEDGDIVLRLPKHMVVDAATDPSLGDTYIKCVNGIKSIKVQISSNSDAMIGSLQQMIDGYPAATFLEGAEIVGNQDIVRLFGDLGQTLEVPAEGDTEYVFPIGNFFQLLAVLEGVHTFDMIVTDMNDNTKKGKLVLAVGCELPEIEEEPEEEEPVSNISLRLPKDMTVTGDTDPSLGDALIECANGIQSIKVTINSDSQDMMNSLAAMSQNYAGVDFINGTEVVDNSALVDLFTGLGQQLAVPTVGDKSYTFPIGNFFSLLAFLPGHHTFDMVVTDANGETKSGRLVLTVE